MRKKSYKPKEKDAQKLQLALKRFSQTKEFERLPEEIKNILK